MTELSDRLEASANDIEQSARRQRSPQEWDAGITIDGDGGEIVTSAREVVADEVIDPYSSDEDWGRIFAHWGLDPANWEVIDDTIVANAWEGMAGHRLGGGVIRMVQYKARLRRRSGPQERLVATLGNRAARRKAWKRQPPTGPLSWLLAIGDTQIGKPDGDGTYGSIGRWEQVIAEIPDRVAQLRRLGSEMGVGVLAFLGDLKEACDGQYASQAFGSELNNRDQDRYVVELALATVEEMRRCFPEVRVIAVPGNHGERRKDGKAFTDVDDNDDVALIEQVRRITQRDPNLADVLYRFPDSQDLTVTVDVSGVSVAFAHGHQFGGGASLEAKVQKWWSLQSHGLQLPGEARLLLAGHHHHLLVADSGSKVFVGTPAMDGGSNWWRHKNGADGPPGAVSMVVGESVSTRGYAGLEILGSGPLFNRESTA